MTAEGDVRVLVVAKAPVAGVAKTRVGAEVGMDVAAGLAAAALLDTVRTCTTAVGADRCRLAIAGELTDATDGDRLTTALEGRAAFSQRGEGLDERLANAFADLAAEHDGPVVQIGMDTPQVTGSDLAALIAGLDGHDAVLADAEDGGWWALALADPRHGAHLAGVPMSTPGTAAATRTAFEDAGLPGRRGGACCATSTSPRTRTPWPRRCADGSEFARRWRAVCVSAVEASVEDVFANVFRGHPVRARRAGRRPARRPGGRLGRVAATATVPCSTSARDRRWTSAAGRAG